MLQWMDKAGYIRHGHDQYLHRTLVENVIGRKLAKSEVVHHVDGNKKNNENRNFVLCPNQAYHFLLHARQHILERGGHPDTHALCSHCKCLHLKSEFSTAPKRWNGLSNNCRASTNAYRRGKGYKTVWNEVSKLQQQKRRAAANLLKAG